MATRAPGGPRRQHRHRHHPRLPPPVSRIRLARSGDDRVIAGVAGGIGHAVGVDPIVVRLAFVVLTLASGSGVLVYVVAWIALPERRSADIAAGRQRVRLRRAHADRSGLLGSRGMEQAVAVGLVTVGSLLLLRSIGLWFPDTLVWPAALVAVGFGIVWARSDVDERSRWMEAAGRLPGDPVSTIGSGRRALVRLVVGVVLLFVGLGTFVATNDRFAAAGQLAMAVLAAAVGLGLLLGPWIVRLFRELAHERRERIRSEERAEVAAHVHDSVLQTLALIQRRAGSPTETVSLARRQERELRSWLYGDRDHLDGSATISGALRVLVDEVEAEHPVQIDLVTVGDGPLCGPTRALVMAAREAVVNAAKHAGVDDVSVYVEVEDRRVVAFVRDRGHGFDPDAVREDRAGLASSIVGRMERHDGSARVHSAPGEGTEIVLTVERGEVSSEP